MTSTQAADRCIHLHHVFEQLRLLLHEAVASFHVCIDVFKAVEVLELVQRVLDDITLAPLHIPPCCTPSQRFADSIKLQKDLSLMLGV